MATPNRSNISLTKTLAFIEGTRKTATDDDELEEWLELYRTCFEDERGPILRAQDPPDSDSENELWQSKLRNHLTCTEAAHGQSFVLKVYPEVLYEVFSYLGLQDLLSLSRTCRRLRSVLLSISTKPLWQRAICLLDELPPCPEHLSEPQYASLVFSDTCSECGKPLFERMDVRLHVKLCAECQTQLLEVYPVHQNVDRFVPASESIHVSRQDAFVFVLKRDVDQLIQEVTALKTADPNTSLDDLGNARARAMHKRCKNEFDLIEFVCQSVWNRADDAKAARQRRRCQIQQRLLQGVWTSRDMDFSKRLLGSWSRLVDRKKPIDDRVWVKLYPKLEALLRMNQEHKERKARNERRHQRREVLIDRLGSLELSSLVLVETTTKCFQTDPAEPTYRSSDWGRYDITKVKAPFPTAASAMNLPITQTLLNKDISGSDMGRDFGNLRDLIIQDIADWRTQVERDLVGIWRSGDKSSIASDQDPPVTVHQIPQRPNDSDLVPETKDETKPAERVSLPKVQLQFTSVNGKTTKNVHELPEGLRLLLRADAVFRTLGHPLPNRHCSYPEIVSGLQIHPSHGRRSLGAPWDPVAIARDDDASHVPRVFLEALQRPNATSAEMGAYGEIFQCGRCWYHTPRTWQSLVSHYAAEISRLKEAQEMIRELGSTVVYNSTHDIHTKKSYFKIVPPTSRECRLAPWKDGGDLACKVCRSLGITASYQYVYGSTTAESCPILEHLTATHGIVDPIMNEHFKNPYQDSSEDDSDGDSDDDHTIDNSDHRALPTLDELTEAANEADICDSDGEYDTDEAMVYFRKTMKRRLF